MDEITPSKFYKYRSMSGSSAKWVEQTICDNEIYFAPATSFNDPFDLRPVFSLTESRRVQLKEYERLLQKFEPHLSRSERRESARQTVSSALSKENIEKTVTRIQQTHTDHITKEVGILCVSTKRDDILMWSHYADSHRGICLEFDGNFAFMAHAQKVKYSSERQPINPYKDSPDEMLQKALLTKSIHWSYEAEWRLIRYIGRGPGAVKFRPPNLTGVIIGAQAKAATVQSIGTWVRKSESPITIYRATANKTHFSLDITISNDDT